MSSERRNFTFNDIIIMFVIPISLCVVIPYFLYIINNNFIQHFGEFELVFMYLYTIMRYSFYILISFLIYIIYKIKKDDFNKSYAYLFGLVFSIISMGCLYSFDFFVYYNEINPLILVIAITSYVLKIANLRKG